MSHVRRTRRWGGDVCARRARMQIWYRAARAVFGCFTVRRRRVGTVRHRRRRASCFVGVGPQLFQQRLSQTTPRPLSVAMPPAAAAPAALPLPAIAATRFTAPTPPAGGYHALHEDRWEVPRDTPLCNSLPFIDWDRPAAPALFSAPRYQLAGVFIAAVKFLGDGASRHGFYTEDPSNTRWLRPLCQR